MLISIPSPFYFSFHHLPPIEETEEEYREFLKTKIGKLCRNKFSAIHRKVQLDSEWKQFLNRFHRYHVLSKHFYDFERSDGIAMVIGFGFTDTVYDTEALLPIFCKEENLIAIESDCFEQDIDLDHAYLAPSIYGRLAIKETLASGCSFSRDVVVYRPQAWDLLFEEI